MPRREMPENWRTDTSFDGPEHWGMDPKWKPFFPESGTTFIEVPLKEDELLVGEKPLDGNSRPSSLRLGTLKDGLEAAAASSEATGMLVDGDFSSISDASDEDEFSLPGPHKTIRRASSKSSGRRQKRSSQAMIVEDQRGPGRDPMSARTSAGHGDRRWRDEKRRTAPSASSGSSALKSGRDDGDEWPLHKSGSRYRSAIRPNEVGDSSESEVEFDFTEAGISGREPGQSQNSSSDYRGRKSKTYATNVGSTHGREERLPRGQVSSTSRRKGDGVSYRRKGVTEERGGGTSSPISCVGSDSSREGHSADDIQSCASLSPSEGLDDSRHDLTNDSFDARQSFTSPARRNNPADGKRTHTPKGSVPREGGRRKPVAPSTSTSPPWVSKPPASRSGATAVTGQGGLKTRTPSANSKKARKSTPARANEDGWIQGRGGGGSGGGFTGSGGGRSGDPVSAFKASHVPLVDSDERRLKQSKLKFAASTPSSRSSSSSTLRPP